MNNSNLIKQCLLAVCFCLCVTPAVATTKISGGDKHLQYTGRVDFTSPQQPQISWPGTSIAGNFTGQSLAFTLDDQLGKNFFNVFIDGDLQHPIIIQAEKGEKTYVVADKLAEGKHSFLFTKRTEGEEGGTTIKGIELADHAKLLAPPPRLKRKIEFFGDSITSGMANESPDDGPDHLPKDKNNFMAYDAIAARDLNAELHVTSQSGIGVMVSWFPFIMPQFYDQLSAVGNNDTQWNFSSWIPDVVVINLFQNDAWLTDREHRLNPNPNDEQRIQAYIDFVKTIRGKYPKAYIVCALGSMDATKAGSKWPGYVTTAVERMKQENPSENKKMDTLFFEFTGYEAHPRVKQHQANAAKLTALIKQKMNW
ncbi:SGNH/GDSL hydrolase family protein [Cellvibrio sp.]|uniref:SGNH/GDSL hydrolase family protein n=1 Tax=Cellvibrio sp. TaxID=1965322 RepID=UPI0039647BD7